ncbi:MAG: DUF4411 family protein [Desulfomonilaceae bacterium]
MGITSQATFRRSGNASIPQYQNVKSYLSVTAYRELDNRATRQHLIDWVNRNKEIFLVPSPEETQFIAEIFSVRHFQQLINEKQRLTASPVADPFIVASAKVRNACVVTEESFKKNAAKIPNVCEYYGIEWVTIQGFMDKERWRF